MKSSDHFCPGCGVAQQHFGRYPWYFCKSCVATAMDGGGRGLKFSNTGVGGGFAWCYEGDENWITAGHVICLISDRPVLVGEARFGGIVAEPLPDRPLGSIPYKTINLRGKERYKARGGDG